MAGWTRETTGLGGALVAHAAALAWIASHPLPVAPSPGLPPAPPEITVDLSAEPEADAPPGPIGGASQAPSKPVMLAAIAPRGMSRAPAAAPPSTEPSPAPPGEGVPGALPEPAPSLAGLSADALGMGGKNPFLAALPDGPPAPPEAEPRVDNVAPGPQQSLRDGLRDRDHELGLDVSGPVVSIAEELTRPSSTPMNSKALFEVAADAQGNVTSVRLVNASQGFEEWEKVATAMAGALRGRPLRVPEGTAGLSFTLEVTSRWQLPSGFDPDTEVSVFNIPVKKAPKDQKQPKKVEILSVKPKIVEDVPQPGVSAGGIKLPSYHLELFTILGIAMDPTDLTPRPLRVVHARVVKERTL